MEFILDLISQWEAGIVRVGLITKKKNPNKHSPYA